MPILPSFLNREKILPATKSVAVAVKIHPTMSMRRPLFSAASSGGRAGHAGPDIMSGDERRIDVGRSSSGQIKNNGSWNSNILAAGGSVLMQPWWGTKSPPFPSDCFSAKLSEARAAFGSFASLIIAILATLDSPSVRIVDCGLTGSL